jgi:cytochrome c peroxidase
MKKQRLVVPLLGAILFFIACQKTPDLEVREMPIELKQQASFFLRIEGMDYNQPIRPYLGVFDLPSLPVNNHKAELGRVLFYDKNLSADRTVSCASCHQQTRAFADNQALSVGVGGQKSTRNSMALSNVARFAAHYSELQGRRPALLWDGRALDIATQAPLAFANPHEMGLNMSDVVDRVKEMPYYGYSFQKAYGDEDISEARILESLTEFVGAIGGSSSKLDLALDRVGGDLFGTYNEINTTVYQSMVLTAYYGSTFVIDSVVFDTTIMPLMGFNDSELRGRNLFATNCTKCHSPIRTVQEQFMACNGLETSYADAGLGGVTGRPEDRGVFKSPSLRNIQYSGPYMHDGRFETLNEVLDFYSTGIQDHPNLHPLLRQADGTPVRMNFSAQDKQDLIAFLNTMTSMDVLTDDRFSDPFRR